MNELQSFGRKVLVLPPLALLGCGLVTLVAAYFAYGAADSIGWPAWLPGACALLFGAAAIAVGGFTAVDIWRRTARGYRVNAAGALVTAPVFLLAAAAVVMLALRVGDATTYEDLRNEEGEVTISVGTFLFLNALLTLIATGVFAAFAYAYRQAITVDLPSRFARTAGEIDAMRALIDEPRRPEA
jgi:hypothetical protein